MGLLSSVPLAPCQVGGWQPSPACCPQGPGRPLQSGRVHAEGGPGGRVVWGCSRVGVLPSSVPSGHTGQARQGGRAWDQPRPPWFCLTEKGQLSAEDRDGSACPAPNTRPLLRCVWGGYSPEVTPCPAPPPQGCRSVEEFQCLNRIEEGTYGVVYRAKDKKTGGQGLWWPPRGRPMGAGAGGPEQGPRALAGSPRTGVCGSVPALGGRLGFLRVSCPHAGQRGPSPSLRLGSPPPLQYWAPPSLVLGTALPAYPASGRPTGDASEHCLWYLQRSA